jgi:hypothetical protein
MARNPAAQPASGPATSRRPVAAPKKGRRAISALARSTLLAAGFAVAQLGIPEIDSRFHIFAPNLLDRLHAPITRYHE